VLGDDTFAVVGTIDPWLQVLDRPHSRTAREEWLLDWHTRQDPRGGVARAAASLWRYPPRGSRLGRERQAWPDAGTPAPRPRRDFAGPVASLVDGFVFCRGLVASIELSGMAFAEHATRLSELAPVQHLGLRGPLPDLATLLERPEFLKLTSLYLSDVGLTDNQATVLAQAANLRRLRVLILSRNRLGKAGVEALAGSASLSQVGFLPVVC
jgi:hypothetical protein